MPHADRPYKVTIVARGSTGGHTRYLPEEDRKLWTRNQFESVLAAALGGRVAEEVVFEEMTTGASNDLEQATNVARTMVTRYGMSEKLGPRTFGKREELVFLGKELHEQRDYSDRVAEQIDEEVHGLIDRAYVTAQGLLKSHGSTLKRVAEYLIANETVQGDDLQELLKGPDVPQAAPAG